MALDKFHIGANYVTMLQYRVSFEDVVDIVLQLGLNFPKGVPRMLKLAVELEKIYRVNGLMDAYLLRSLRSPCKEYASPAFR